jgi:cellulose synthase/poly-beta-1,6-N-acetylglucosamine synthase-like glycosyltransferase
MVVPFANPEVMGVKGVYRTRQRSLVARFAQAEYEEKYARLARMQWIDFVDTYAAAYRKAPFQAHGGFDARFLLDEDQEFSFRLAEAGHKLKFTPQAVVYHQHQATAWGYARRKAQLARWKVQVSVLHPGKAIRDSYTPWTQKAQIAFLFLALLGTLLAALGMLPWIGAALCVLLGLIFALPLVVRAQEQGWSVAILAPAMIVLRTLASAIGLCWGIIEYLIRKAGIGSLNQMEEGDRK